ncbi:MAG: hypothetical protein ABSG65_17845 [Bryobacteraceae bacterium]|jgi:hypothetical protein
MRRIAAVTVFLAGLAFLPASQLPSQKVAGKGREWLDSKTDPAEINVNGTWYGGVWGRVILKQAEGSREVTGTGDEWDILGIVSGRNLYLLFSHKGHIAYSAELSQDGPNALAGRYADGLLTGRSKTRLMHLFR